MTVSPLSAEPSTTFTRLGSTAACPEPVPPAPNLAEGSGAEGSRRKRSRGDRPFAVDTRYQLYVSEPRYHPKDQSESTLNQDKANAQAQCRVEDYLRTIGFPLHGACVGDRLFQNVSWWQLELASWRLLLKAGNGFFGLFFSKRIRDVSCSDARNVNCLHTRTWF